MVRLVVLTDRRSAAGPLVTVVEQAVLGGAGWVVLRERDLGYAQRRALADRLRAVLPPGRLIVAGPDPLGGDAVHLAVRDPLPPPGLRLVGRSCHSRSEIDRLSTEDYMTLSPIYPSDSKPGHGPPLGPATAAALAGKKRWLALGGVDSAPRVRECLAAGADGVAVMGVIMRAGDPAAVAASLKESGSAVGWMRGGCPTAPPLGGLG